MMNLTNSPPRLDSTQALNALPLLPIQQTPPRNLVPRRAQSLHDRPSIGLLAPPAMAPRRVRSLVLMPPGSLLLGVNNNNVNNINIVNNDDVAPFLPSLDSSPPAVSMFGSAHSRLPLKRRDTRRVVGDLVTSDGSRDDMGSYDDEEEEGFDSEIAALSLPHSSNLDDFQFPPSNMTAGTTETSTTIARVMMNATPEPESPRLVRFGVPPPPAPIVNLTMKNAPRGIVVPTVVNHLPAINLKKKNSRSSFDRAASESHLQVPHRARFQRTKQSSWLCVPAPESLMSESSPCKENKKPRLHYDTA